MSSIAELAAETAAARRVFEAARVRLLIDAPSFDELDAASEVLEAIDHRVNTYQWYDVAVHGAVRCGVYDWDASRVEAFSTAATLFGMVDDAVYPVVVARHAGAYLLFVLGQVHTVTNVFLRGLELTPSEASLADVIIVRPRRGRYFESVATAVFAPHDDARFCVFLAWLRQLDDATLPDTYDKFGTYEVVTALTLSRTPAAAGAPVGRLNLPMMPPELLQLMEFRFLTTEP
jgi:hypothetical protein